MTDQEQQAKPSRLWLSDMSIRQPVFITMLVLAVLVVGAISYSRMGLDLYPNISIPVAVIQTAWPGASPADVERSVTKPVENAVISINGVDTVSSTSLDSVSQVVIQFQMDKDVKVALDDVRTKINTIRNSLPSDVKDPVILRMDPSDAPILSFAVADRTGKLSPAQLRSLADDTLTPRLEQVGGVGAVNVTGGVVRQVHVDLKATQLDALGISPQQVTQAIKAENLDLPAGRITDGQREALVHTAAQARSLAQLGDIPVAVKPNGATIKLQDLASVVEGQADVRNLSRLDGQASVIIQIQKQAGTNTVQVADDVKSELAQLQKEYPDLSFAIAADQSTFTRQSVNDTLSSLILGAILAALIVLLFFRDLRNTLVTVVGLPVVVLGTFAIIYSLGITLNLISMMALSLSIGMLIDDAIVVRENIFRHMERGEDPKVAASHGTGEIALAVLAVTSTIVAVFLPIAFTGGLAGKFLRDFGITIAVAVLISLVEAFTLAPMLSAYFFKRVEPGRLARGRPNDARGSFGAFSQSYRNLLAWSLRHRLVVVVAGLAVFAASIGIIPLMTFAFQPDVDQGVFSVGITLPPGALLSDTDRAAKAIERIVQQAPEVQHIFTTVGDNTGNVQNATISATLFKSGHTDALIARLRPEMERAVANAKLTVDRQSASARVGGGASGAASAPIQFAVQGDDFKALERVSAELVSRFQQIPGAVDADRSIKAGEPGQTIVLDRAKATDLGVTATQVGATARTLLNGDVVGTYPSGDKDLDIVVRLSEADRANPDSILRLPITTLRGSQIPLSTVASLIESSEPNLINRANRQRQVLVWTNYMGRGAGAVQADAQAIVNSLDLPQGVTIEAAGQTKFQAEMFSSFGLALGLAVLFVYMILASQFGSFVHPFTIMLALPFSIVGALLSLFAFRFSLDMLSLIGIILLMGLVSKNSILLVEFINQMRRRGLSTRDAILEAGPIRLRPIMMTTLAMILGMVPVATGLGAGSEMRQPMGIAVIGGLITSTLLTLVVVPVVYSLIAGVSGKLLRAKRLPLAAQSAEPVIAESKS